jgi:hypothetical protein
MIARSVFLASLAVALSAPPAMAQVATRENARDSVDILRTILMPAIAATLRERGIPAEEIEAAVLGARASGVPASETSDILRRTVRATDEYGPIDNFGAYVQELLRSGLRGRDLADAIHAEHARRGIGAAGRGGERREPGEVGDSAGRRGPPAERGRPDEAGDSAGRRGPPVERGRPDGSGGER